jgi:hypothetical protein
MVTIICFRNIAGPNNVLDAVKCQPEGVRGSPLEAKNLYISSIGPQSVGIWFRGSSQDDDGDYSIFKNWGPNNALDAVKFQPVGVRGSPLEAKHL